LNGTPNSDTLPSATVVGYARVIGLKSEQVDTSQPKSLTVKLNSLARHFYEDTNNLLHQFSYFLTYRFQTSFGRN
jgi:hypothetical protein